MKELNQIVLCSNREGRAFVRELALFERFAVVTGVEPLPYNFHHVLKKSRGKKELVTTIDVSIRRPTRYRFCMHCGNDRDFVCRKCGFVSCLNDALEIHYCPGCDKKYTHSPMSKNYASASGLIKEPSIFPTKDNFFTNALWKMMEHKNQTDH